MLIRAILVIVIVLACLALATFLPFFFAGPRTIMHFGHDLRWEKCAFCTAGSQWWDGENWVAIPPHARKVTDGRFTIEPPQANVRRCPECLGSPGGHWRDRNGYQKLRSPDWRQIPKQPGEDDIPWYAHIDPDDQGSGQDGQ